jgi:adenylate cyclase
MVASQLESATRRVLADVVVSEDTIKATGRGYRGTTTLKVSIKGRDKPLTAYGFASAPEIAKDEDEPAAAMPAGTKAAPSQDQAQTADAAGTTGNGKSGAADEGEVVIPEKAAETVAEDERIDEAESVDREAKPARKPKQAARKAAKAKTAETKRSGEA